MYGYLAGIIITIACMIEISDHNKKVDAMFPDLSNGSENEKRRSLRLPFYLHGFLLVVLLGFFIKSLTGN